MSYKTDLRRKWPDVPHPWNLKQYSLARYRDGFKANYAGEAAKVFQDPLGNGARAYFAGWFAGGEAREAGWRPPDADERIVPVPKRFTSGDSFKAYRAAYRIASTLEEGTTLVRQNELYGKWRLAWVTDRAWNSGAAFDEGWKAGLDVCPNTIQRGLGFPTLPPPSGLPVNLPPPQ